MTKWVSKLGGVYDKEEIMREDAARHARLNKLRRRPENRKCADCGVDGTCWTVVNHGIFVCMRCGGLHRSLGTHISIPKGATGTYLWGADELRAMEVNGNAKSNENLGGDRIPTPDGTSDHAMLEHIRDKYERRRWAQRQEVVETPQRAPVEVADLLGLADAPREAPRDSGFFAEFGL
mmetsp:Transcript_2577/g.6623  ORF Transcript_2577/g.6623 Transcript_2577/m.6623 type:complete len:178 (+) Transcript_2577:78-611(+)